ncbi:MAG TPA: C39 family peptidase [Gemmataceae bacterium]|nr:C39 family peptidase [Gemmataceae bacterium]
MTTLRVEALERRDTPSWLGMAEGWISKAYHDWFQANAVPPQSPALEAARPNSVFIPIAGADQVAAQTDSWSCGPNSAARFLQFYGVHISYEQARYLATKLYNAPYEHPGQFGLGANPQALVNLIHEFKPQVQLKTEQSIDQLLDVLAQRKPVIALIQPDLNSAALHYVVVQGYDQKANEIFFKDTDGNTYATNMYHFLQMWNWNVGFFLNGPYAVAGLLPRTMIY